MKRTFDSANIVAILYLIAGILGLTFLLSGCAVKKVEKSDTKTMQVVQHYLKTHPVKNDTTFILKQGDTIRTEKKTSDTVYKKGKDSISYATITNTIVQTKVIRDTVFRNVESHKFEAALQKDIVNMNDELIKCYALITEYKAQIAELRHEESKWKLRFFLLLGAISLFTLYRIVSIFKPISI